MDGWTHEVAAFKADFQVEIHIECRKDVEKRTTT